MVYEGTLGIRLLLTVLVKWNEWEIYRNVEYGGWIVDYDTVANGAVSIVEILGNRHWGTWKLSGM